MKVRKKIQTCSLFFVIVLTLHSTPASGALSINVGDVFRYTVNYETGELFVESHSYMGLKFDLSSGESVFEIEVTSIQDASSDPKVTYSIYTPSGQIEDDVLIDSFSTVPVVTPAWDSHQNKILDRQDLYQSLGWEESITVDPEKVSYEILTRCCSGSEGVDEVISEKSVVFDKSIGIVVEYQFTETTHKSDSTTDIYSLSLGLDPNAEFTRFTSVSDDGTSDTPLQSLIIGFLTITIFARKRFTSSKKL